MPARASRVTRGEDLRLNRTITRARRKRRCALRFSGTARSSSIRCPSQNRPAEQVLVRTLACGICGSDLHARKHAHRMVELARHFPGRKPMDLARDVVFGHEFCCEMLDYGPGSERKLKPGTRVCSLPALLTAQGPRASAIPTTMSAAMPSACCSARRCCWRCRMGSRRSTRR